MARSVLASDLLARLRENCDIENDTHSANAELYKVLSSAVAETWDVIVASGLAEQYVKSVSFSATAGTDPVLESVCTDGDFYKIHQLYAVTGSGVLRPLTRINSVDVEPLRANSQTVALKLYYIPCAPVISAGTESINGFNGWEEHILACAEIQVRKKRDEDFSGAYRRKQELEARIARMANTDWSQPARVTRRRYSRQVLDVIDSMVSCYVLRGGKIELYESDPYGVRR